MSSRPLDPDTALGVRLSAICSRNRYTHDPGPVIAELRAAAGDRSDILAKEAGTWAGFHDSEYTHALVAALLEIPGAAAWESSGRERRTMGWHSTPGT